MDPIDWHQRFTQQAQWTASLRRYLIDRLQLPTEARVLEVGCGTGAVLDELSSPGMEVHGLDLDEGYLRQAQANAPKSRLAQGDAYRLPYRTGSFDLVVCHFLLLWLENPLSALNEMRRAARPGGWVAALAEPDYGGRIDYPPELAVVGQMQRRALIEQGARPDTGRMVGSLLAGCGLDQVEAGVLGGQWQLGMRSTQERELEWAVLAHDLGNRLPDAELERLKSIDLEAVEAGARVLFVPTFYAVGRKPEHS